MDRITRTIYWNESAGGWYDVETDVSVKNLTRPDDDVPLQSDTDESVQHMIEREIDKRTVFLLSRMCFNSSPDDDKLVTVGHVKRMLMHEGKMTHDQHKQLETRIVGLHERVWKLERPWWKIW